MRRTFSLIAAAMLTLASLVVPGSAYASCNPERQVSYYNGFSGVQGGPSPYPYGIKADIYEYDPYVESGGNVSAWVMLKAPSGQTPKWAQIGWWKTSPSASHQVFTQNTDQYGYVYTNTFAGNAIGSTHTYRVSYVGGVNPQFYFYKDSNLLLTNVEYWLPTAYMIDGETHNNNDQMPGGYNGHEPFTNTYYQNNSLGWTSLTDPANASSPIYGAVRINSIRYEIWDTGCAS